VTSAGYHPHMPRRPRLRRPAQSTDMSRTSPDGDSVGAEGHGASAPARGALPLRREARAAARHTAETEKTEETDQAPPASTPATRAATIRNAGVPAIGSKLQHLSVTAARQQSPHWHH
jgi:hypothetical protein